MPTAQRPTPVPAVLLAGGKTTPEFAAEAGVPATSGSRSLAEINGWPMVRYVVQALREAELVSRIVLVAPSGFPEQPGVDVQVAGEGGLVENIRTGLRQCGEAEHALFVTADIPFLTGEAMDDYVRRCEEAAVDCCYAAIPIEACNERFPGMRRTCLRTPQVTVTGGNIVYQRIAAFDRQGKVLEQAYQRRKNPLFLVQLIGPGNFLKLLTGRLTLEDVERGASRAFGTRCRLIVTPYPEVGTDVDKPDDLRLARRILRPAAP